MKRLFKIKNGLFLSVAQWILLSILVFGKAPVFAFEQEAGMPRVDVITHGMTRTIEIFQNDSPFKDFGHFLILVVGYGGLSITLMKIDAEGDLLFLSGAGISPSGIDPFFKFGTTQVTLKEAVEIGDAHSPYGWLWILSWVDSPVHHPPYHYTLVLSF